MKTLREAINEAVVGHLKDKLETGEGIDVAEMAHELTQSLVDMIMEQEEEHQAPLLASIVVSLGDEYLPTTGLYRSQTSAALCGLSLIVGASTILRTRAFRGCQQRYFNRCHWNSAPSLCNFSRICKIPSSLRSPLLHSRQRS